MKNQRLFFLDRLRVIAFSLLIIDHTSIFFTEKHFWITDKDYLPEIKYLVLFFRPWRMSLIFLIAGAALFLSSKKRTIMQVVKDRAIRILFPLLAGMLIIIPPQTYFIRKHLGYDESYWQFYKALFRFEWFPRGNFHYFHLWFLAYVFTFSLLIIPIIKGINTGPIKHISARVCEELSKPAVLFLFMPALKLPFALFGLLVAGSADVSRAVQYFPFFFFGALFFVNKYVQAALQKHCRAALMLAILTTVFYFGGMHLNGNVFVKVGKYILFSFNQWFWIIAIAGYARRFLNFGSEKLDYLNPAVYPFYILHQTIIVIIAYHVVRTDMNLFLKWGIIFFGTFALPLVLYEALIKRTVITRLIFGLKVDKV